MNDARETVLDARGRLCPQPMIDLARCIEGLTVGSVVRILSDDAAIVHDLPAWCQGSGHELLSLSSQGPIHSARVRKAHDRSL